MNLCDDNRTATIEAAKMALIKGTNIEDSQDEMKVLDSFLLRCWQMGWLYRYEPPRHFNAMPKEISERMTAGHGSNVPMQPNIPPMPTNTSNALKTLDSVNATQSNALGEQTKWNRMMLHLADLQLTYSPDWGANVQGDQKLYDFVTGLIEEFSGWDVSDTNVGEMITKKQMIDVLERTKRIANDVLCDGPVLMSYNDVLDSLINIVNFLPSAQPEKRTEERTETHGVCLDAISRQAAIELCDWYDNPSMREDLEKLRPVRFSADTISRKAVTDAIEKCHKQCCREDACGDEWIHYETTLNEVESIQPAQTESDAGRWERHYSRPGVYADLCWHCSKCGYKTNYQYANVNHRYCPNCGAKMEG